MSGTRERATLVRPTDADQGPATVRRRPGDHVTEGCGRERERRHPPPAVN